jgi:Zn-dependent M16 (insulinase) family peptidase
MPASLPETAGKGEEMTTASDVLVHGFETVYERDVPEYNTRAILYRHVKTGAQLLSLENDDENKCFAVNFSTPPEDSTGIAHILEHSVLCGSRKFPVKDPFVQLMKSSLNTFLNAGTFPDRTVYPVASQNSKDFYNLVEVYLDACFFPRITPDVLMQEGWHYELEDVDSELHYKGVVFNEMKGAYSSPDGLLMKRIQESILPESTYGVDSGGDPAVIPDLTYEQFKSFHTTLYHPSNACIYFYGNDHTERRLELVAEYLDQFDRIDVNAEVTKQPLRSEPWTETHGYPVSAEEAESGKTYVALNWVVGESTDVDHVLSWDILSHILIGTPASPLRKALIDSGLGDDLIRGGYDSYTLQTVFSTGLKGVDPADTAKVESVILDTLTSLSENGIDPDTVAASMNTTEFRMRELNTGSFPKGLALFYWCLGTWNYGGDPLDAISFEDKLAAIKQRVSSGGYFEQVIRDGLLANGHRSTVIMTPDPEMAERLEADERGRLDAARAAMTPEQLTEIVEQTKSLRLAQGTPDTAEAIAALPTLTRDDLDPAISTIPSEEHSVHDCRVLYHELPTAGILYFDLGLDLHTLPAHLLPYADMFGRALFEMGTTKADFVQLGQRIGMETGGIHASSFFSAVHDSDTALGQLFLRGKAMLDRTENLFAILEECLTEVRLDNRERFTQMVLDAKASIEARLVPAGHMYAIYRVQSRFTEAGWANDLTDGLGQLFFLRGLEERLSSDWDGVLADLEEIRAILVNRNQMIFNVTVEAAGWEQARRALTTFIDNLPGDTVEPLEWDRGVQPKHEGLTIPAQVNYVGKGARLYDLGYTLDGSVAVLGKFLKTAYLWEKIRVQGGAYGGFSVFDRHSGTFAFASYRDPNLSGTIDNYDRAGEFLRTVPLTEAEVGRNIIGAIGELDRPQLPDGKGFTSLIRTMVGETDARRQAYRDQVLATTVDSFRAFADVLDAVKDQGQTAVIGAADRMTELTARYPDAEIVSVL